MNETTMPFLDFIKIATMSPVEERAVSLNICTKCLGRNLVEKSENVKQCQECFTVYVVDEPATKEV